MGKRCRSSVTHRSGWVALDRNWLRMHAGDSGHATPGIHTLYCPACKTAWRTRAQYARTLPTGVSGGWRETKQLWAVEKWPLVAELTYVTEPGSLVYQKRHIVFLSGMAEKFNNDGKISHKQAEAVERIIGNLIESANVAQDNRAAMEAMGERLAPDEYAEVIGRVESVWYLDQEPNDPRPPVPKMALEADAGYVVECTVPKKIAVALKYDLQQLIGRRVELHAQFRRHRTRWDFAWGSYPRSTSRLI